MKKDLKSFIISVIVFLSLAGVVVGLSRFVDVLSPFTSASDTSSDVTDSSSEEPFDISEVYNYSVQKHFSQNFMSYGGVAGVEFTQDGDWYVTTWDAIPEFTMSFGFNEPTTTFYSPDSGYYLGYYEDGHGIGSSTTETSLSKFSLQFSNFAAEGGNSYRVGLDIASSGHDVFFTLSDDLGHFELDFTFYQGEVSYIEVAPGETLRLDHIAATTALYIDAIYIYYF